MKLILSAAVLALAAFAASTGARADWLSDAWSAESVRRNGNPAVTIGRDGIHVVLPASTLRQAHEEGVTTEQALGDFLEKYAQRCSGLLNLNAPQPNLKVRLSLQNPASSGEVFEDNAVLAELMTEYLQRRGETGSTVLFTVSPGHVEYSIDYAPKRLTRCGAPEMPSS
jgi:hypothetical protein